ncbi:MAG: L-threonylcarbamoyladenylate synthase [Candidatus Dormibacteria bacterium]
MADPELVDTLDGVAGVVAAGGVIIIPTDTVYGLACGADSVAAVARIEGLKRRPPDLELSLLAGTRSDLHGLVRMSDTAERLAERFWPGALSLICPLGKGKRLAIPRRAATLMVRVPAHPLLRRLLEMTGPLASTSANRHGESPAATADEARVALGADVDALLDGGPGAGLASTIIETLSTPPRVLREGLILIDELAPYLGG